AELPHLCSLNLLVGILDEEVGLLDSEVAVSPEGHPLVIVNVALAAIIEREQIGMLGLGLAGIWLQGDPAFGGPYIVVLEGDSEMNGLLEFAAELNEGRREWDLVGSELASLETL